MTENAPVSVEEARYIIAEWARLYDLQEGLSAFLPIIAEDGFYMQGHTVDLFEYLRGFAPDDAQDYDPHLDTRWGRR